MSTQAAMFLCPSKFSIGELHNALVAGRDLLAGGWRVQCMVSRRNLDYAKSSETDADLLSESGKDAEAVLHRVRAIASGPSRPISWCWPTTTSGRSSPLLRVSVNCSSWASQASLRTRCVWGPAPALSSSRSLIIQDTSRVEASTGRTQFVSTGLLDVDEFDSLQAAADLYVSDNLTSGVMAQAAPLGTPVLAMLNTTGASPEAFPSSAPAQQERRKEGASKEWAS